MMAWIIVLPILAATAAVPLARRWFEGRRPPGVLMVGVDDATNRLRARFFEAETTHASYDTFEGWVRRHGSSGIPDGGLRAPP